MTGPTKRYLVDGILVEATKSAGSGFYDVKVIETGTKYRFLAEVFEMVAKEVKE